MTDDAERVQLLAELEEALRKHGCRVRTESGTLCIDRPDWDERAGQTFAMASAISSIERKDRAFRVVVQELRDEERAVRKYSITLLDSENRALHAWHRDTKRGQHQHEYKVGVKLPDHIPHEGSIDGIATEMIQRMDGS